MAPDAAQVRSDILSGFYLDKYWWAGHTRGMEKAPTAATPSGAFLGARMVPSRSLTGQAAGFDSPALHLQFTRREA